MSQSYYRYQTDVMYYMFQLTKYFKNVYSQLQTVVTSHNFIQSLLLMAVISTLSNTHYQSYNCFAVKVISSHMPVNFVSKYCIQELNVPLKVYLNNNYSIPRLLYLDSTRVMRKVYGTPIYNKIRKLSASSIIEYHILQFKFTVLLNNSF